MAIVTLTKWGNSIGIRVPSTILKQAHLKPGTKLEITADENGQLILKPIVNPREGWLEEFNKAADNKHDDKELDFGNDFDEDEWTW